MCRCIQAQHGDDELAGREAEERRSGNRQELPDTGELDVLNRIVNLYLEFAELQALNRKPMTMQNWIAKLDEYLRLSEREILHHAGKISHVEVFVAHLLEKMGYHTRLMRTGEPSVDIIAHKDDLGFEPPIIKVQVKSSDGKIGDRDVSALYGKVGEDEYGLLEPISKLP